VARAEGDYPRARALLEQSIAVGRGAGGPGGLWHAWRSSACLGRIEYLQGEYGAAAARLRACLAQARERAGEALRGRDRPPAPPGAAD
jgi:hypothetical protein